MMAAEEWKSAPVTVRRSDRLEVRRNAFAVQLTRFCIAQTSGAG